MVELCSELAKGQWRCVARTSVRLELISRSSTVHSIVYHVSFSLMLPHLATPTPVATSAGHESLVLHAPRSSPVPTSSTAHLRLFLSEQVATVVAAAARKT